MELDRKYVNLCRQKGEVTGQLTLEEDLNVPDQKPDIDRIIYRKGQFTPDEIKGEEGKVKVRGMFSYRILYLAEDERRMPEYLEGSIPVDEILFLDKMEEGDALDIGWELEDIHASMIHSRKANIKCILSLSASCSRQQPAAMVSGPEGESGLYLKTCPVWLQQEVLHKKDTLRIKEDINLPAGRPNIRRLLWTQADLRGCEVRPEEGKFLVKGEIAVFFLYEAEEGTRPEWIEQTVPFREELESNVCHGDLFGQTTVRLLQETMELQADYDGEPRLVRLEAALELVFHYYEEESREILCDAYSLTKEIVAQKNQYEFHRMLQAADARARVGGRMKLPEDMPGMIQILSSFAELHPDYVKPTQQGLNLQGSLQLFVLYASADDGQPFACAGQTFPFEYTLESPEGAGQTSGIHLGLDQLSVNMLDEKELEMKAVLQVQTLFSRPETLELVEDLKEQELDTVALKRMPGMVIHIVQPGEELWEIAKTHATTCEHVLELNDVKEEQIRPGTKLLLVKEAGR